MKKTPNFTCICTSTLTRELRVEQLFFETPIWLVWQSIFIRTQFLPSWTTQEKGVSSPVCCPKKKRVVLAKSESSLVEGNLKSPQKPVPFQSKSPLIPGSLKSPTTSAPMNEFGDRCYLSAVSLFSVSDGLTVLYQEHNKAILDHLQDHLLHSRPAYLKGHWPVPAKFYLDLGSFYQIYINDPSDHQYGL